MATVQANTQQGGGCACCGTAEMSSIGPVVESASAVRSRFVAGAEQLGITADDLTGQVAWFDAGDCPATQARMAELVGTRLAAAQEYGVALTERAAAVQAAHGGDRPGMPAEVADLTGDIGTGLAAVARLQSAAARLADPPTPGACHDGCACVTAASAPPTPRIPAVRAALTPAGGSGSDIVCTLDGGLDAMQWRTSEWTAVIGRATGREPTPGGVTLVYDHDPVLIVELARLAAAEFACCSFFTFALTVAPDGVRFTVTAPAEAAAMVTAMFGTATPAPVGGNR